VNAFNSVVSDDLSELRAVLCSAPDAASLHPIGLREVVHGEGAVEGLADVVRRAGVVDGSSVTVLSDPTPKHYADRDVVDVVLDVLGAHYQVSLERLMTRSSDGVVLADEDTVASALSQVRRRVPSGLVSVGSGTLTDIAKVVADELSLTHVVVQTAASVNGFADDQSVLLINGAKRTTPSRWPDALVIDPLVISGAPLGMTRSGLGDQLSMFTASADWYLANAVGFDTSYSPTLVSMMREGVDSLLSTSTDLGRGQTSAVSALAACLTRGGLAMGAAGRTAPSSGLEHAISHLLEMRADADGQPSASHGSQVGAASVVAALAWRRVLRRLAEGRVTLLEQNVATRERVLDAFAHLDSSQATAQECWRLYQRKSTWIRSHVGNLTRTVHDWPTHGQEIDRLLKPVEVVVAALREARAPVAFHQLSPAPDRDVVVWAVSNCHLMRDRFGLIDLADLIGAWTPDDVASVLGELDELAI
jgi:glycerol-1-phosphate dehydrogenase [NAD(P)+]